jgi:AcrR family transcriptional regulator
MAHEDLRHEILAATLRCLSRWGLSKTTLDDIARESRCSRATVYRLFPGGKETLLAEVAADEVERFFASIGARLERSLDVEELLVEGLTEALRQLRDHPALGSLLEREPGRLLPQPASGAIGHVVAISGAFLTPHLGRWLEPTPARQAADWVVRMALSYAITPPPAPDPADPFGVRVLVEDLLAPAVHRLAAPVPSTL